VCAPLTLPHLLAHSHSRSSRGLHPNGSLNPRAARLEAAVCERSHCVKHVTTQAKTACGRFVTSPHSLPLHSPSLPHPHTSVPPPARGATRLLSWNQPLVHTPYCVQPTPRQVFGVCRSWLATTSTCENLCVPPQQHVVDSLLHHPITPSRRQGHGPLHLPNRPSCVRTGSGRACCATSVVYAADTVWTEVMRSAWGRCRGRALQRSWRMGPAMSARSAVTSLLAACDVRVVVT